MAPLVLEPEQAKDMIEAFRQARQNLVDYRRILLSNDPLDEVAPAPFHFQWSEDLLHGSENEAIEGYRESAKSQYVLRAFCLYALSFPSTARDYIVILKNNARLAHNKLKQISKEYKGNPVISGNLVRIHEDSGERFSVDVLDDDEQEHNVLIEAYGKGASIRGLADVDRRPRIVILDDPQDKEDAKSETIMESDWNWFLSDVRYLGRKTRVFLIGNNLGEKCIVERAQANDGDLGYKSYTIPEMKEDGTMSWPARVTPEEHNAEKERFRRLGKLDIFLMEKQCVAVGEETRVFNPADYRYFSPGLAPQIMAACNPFATLDPASSKAQEACYRAIVVNGVDVKSNWFIPDVRYGRWDTIELLNQMFDVVVRWKLTQFGIEKGIFKQVLEPIIYQEMARRKVFFDIVEIEHAKEGRKLDRIKALAPRFKAHTIWFPDEAPWLTEMLAELAGVTKDAIKSLFIDLVDALAMQTQIATAPFNNPESVDERSLPRQALTD